jgi:thioredoxin 1
VRERSIPVLVNVVDRPQFEAEVVRSEVPVLVDFWAPWCPPCRAIAPELEALAASVEGAKVVKVDVGQNPDLAVDFKVTSIPALVFFKGGQEVRRHVGIRPREALRADLEALKRV